MDVSRENHRSVLLPPAEAFRSLPPLQRLRRLRASLFLIGIVELGHSFDPLQCFFLIAPIQGSNLGGDALANRTQARVRHHKTQFPQTTSAPTLAHRPHSFSRSRHFDLP